jgi:hypothetical protein
MKGITNVEPVSLAALVPLAFIIYWVVDLCKDISNADKNGIVTKVTAWVGAFGVLSLYAHSGVNLAASLAFVATLSWTGLAFLALAVAASGGVLSDGFRTFNRNDPNVKSKLLK